MPSDFQGIEVKVGDRGFYVSGGRYTGRSVVEVIEVKKKIKVITLNSKTLEPFIRRSGALDESWIEPGSFFISNEMKPILD